MKPVKESSIPSVVCSVAIEPKESRADDRTGVTEMCVARWSTHIREGETVTRFTSPDVSLFWQRMAKLCVRNRNVWIIALDVATAFQCLGGWNLSESGQIGWGNIIPESQRKNSPGGEFKTSERCALILSPGVAIVQHQYHLGRMTWVNVANYTPSTLHELAKTIGIESSPGMQIGTASPAWSLDSKTDAVIIGEFFRRWQAAWIQSDSGHWSATAAMLSHQLFRRRFYGGDLVEHREPNVAKMEREGIYGGRQSVFFYGRVITPGAILENWHSSVKPVSPAVVAGPVHHLDVRSQYPALLRDKVFPVALDREFESISVERLESICRHRCVIAEVDVHSPGGLYPRRVRNRQRVSAEYAHGRKRVQTDFLGSRVDYARGVFRTTLYGPELLLACERGHIRRVVKGWEYRPGRPFQSFADHLIKERFRARKSGDAVAELTLKLMANAFAGKFAARSGGWRTVTDAIPQKRWGEWFEANLDSPEAVAYRAFAGIVQRHERADNEPKGYSSIFGYLTSYGRVQMLKLIEAAGEQNTLWCHTDALIVNDAGLENLRAAGLIQENKPGELEYKTAIQSFAAWGPSHYFADGQWTLAGFSPFLGFDELGRYREMVSPGLAALFSDPEAEQVRYAVTSKVMPSRPAGVVIGRDGRAKHFNVKTDPPPVEDDGQSSLLDSLG